jgi:hypothetical protein
MTTLQKLNEYNEIAKEFSKKYGVEDSHIFSVVASVMMTRDKFQAGGSFVQAVVNNNLWEAINRADTECLKHIKVIVAAREYAHIFKNEFQ